MGKETRMIALMGEEIETNNSWGDARKGFFTIIKNIHEKNIWHEIVHLIGAEDHYDEDTLKVKSICKNNRCIMRYGKTKGVLCQESLNEIRNYLNNTK